MSRDAESQVDLEGLMGRRDWDESGGEGRGPSSVSRPGRDEHSWAGPGPA